MCDEDWYILRTVKEFGKKYIKKKYILCLEKSRTTAHQPKKRMWEWERSTTEEDDTDSIYTEVTPGSGSTNESTSGSSVTATGTSSKISSETTIGESTGNTSETSTGSTFDLSTGTTYGTSTATTYETTDTSSTTELQVGEEEDESEKDAADSFEIDLKFLLPQDILNINSRHIRSEDPRWALSPVPELMTVIIKASKYIKG
ncbi:hypothetical protein NPIL_216681 [Nephila pilipes]|uniref:Uncharacterized protein n=1 Tax=Nephila pilipes TaxID=299642 RepID=A0A8X6NZS4_NEPPI|nr:hypothetical protein NPIL_216681 [Nephila pilipes]